MNLFITLPTAINVIRDADYRQEEEKEMLRDKSGDGGLKLQLRYN